MIRVLGPVFKTLFRGVSLGMFRGFSKNVSETLDALLNLAFAALKRHFVPSPKNGIKPIPTANHCKTSPGFLIDCIFQRRAGIGFGEILG
jgi:hypothetical protein